MAASPKFVMSTIVPTGLLIVGVFIFKREWLPIVSGLAAIFAGVQFLALTGGQNDPNVPLNKQTTESARSESVAAMPVPDDEEPDAPMMKTMFKDYPLSNITKLSHNVAIYRFDLPKKTDALPLPTGQHLAVTTTIDGKDVLRSYTPVSSHLDLGYFDLLIKEYPTGNISKHIASLKIGDTLKVRGPKGAMVYEPNMCRHIGMIAGGTGLTPMLQIIQAIVRERPVNGGKDTTKVDFIFANVNEEDILLKDVLDKLAKEDEYFNVHYVLNNPPQGWTGGVGFVTADMIKEKLPAPASDIKILLCGPPPMISAMKKATLELGYEKARAVSKLADQVFAF